MTDYDDLGILGVTIAAINERLTRLEEALGITDQVPADIELDRLLAMEDDE